MQAGWLDERCHECLLGFGSGRLQNGRRIRFGAAASIGELFNRRGLARLVLILAGFEHRKIMIGK